MKKVVAAIFSIAAIALAPLSAIANGFVTSAAGNKIFVFTGLTPDQSVPVTISGWPKDKNTAPNACGLTIIAPSTGGAILQIAPQSGMMIDATSLPVQAIPTCVGAALAEPRTANFRTATGQVVLIGQAASQVRIIQNITRNIKANGCGIARLSPPRRGFAGGWWFEGTSFTFGEETLFADDLFGTEEKSICRTIGGQKVKYVPLVI
jgi:hypothetical protein